MKITHMLKVDLITLHEVIIKTNQVAISKNKMNFVKYSDKSEQKI